MNIFDSTPRKVKCIANYDTHIYSIHKDELEIGKLYTVKKVEVDSWCTAVYLEEFPYERGYAFNSVYFEELEGEEKDVPEPKIENRWIPVTERVPDNMKNVLVSVEAKADYGEDFVYIDFYIPDLGEWNEFRYHNVSAWMPLPEPWKGDEE